MTVYQALFWVPKLKLHNNLQQYDFSHFTDKETKAQRDQLEKILWTFLVVEK